MVQTSDILNNSFLHLN